MKEFKVVIMGPGGVGKSALTIQFVSGKFMEKYDPTIEDFYRKEILVDNSPAVLEILDTAGTEQFASMRDLYIRNGQGFILVYSIVNHGSLAELSPTRDQILRIKGTDNVPILLCGNKTDLEHEREISTHEGELTAKQWGCTFMETSAKSRLNVNQLFTEIVRDISMASEPSPQQCCCTLL